MTVETEKVLLSERELASRWSVTLRTLYNWRRAGKGPPFLKIGTRYRYRISDVEEYEESILQNPDSNKD